MKRNTKYIFFSDVTNVIVLKSNYVSPQEHQAKKYSIYSTFLSTFIQDGKTNNNKI